MTPGAIVKQFDVPSATSLFHPKELMNAHLVTQGRNGRNLIYHAAHDRMDTLLGFLTANCRQGEACLEADTTACKR